MLSGCLGDDIDVMFRFVFLQRNQVLQRRCRFFHLDRNCVQLVNEVLRHLDGVQLERPIPQNGPVESRWTDWDIRSTGISGRMPNDSPRINAEQ